MRPRRLGRYELLGHLATGGMAHVHIARVTGPGGFARHVVIKSLPDTHRDDAASIAMFLDEARLMATLHHQHIAQVFEVGRADDGVYFLAMEYVHGETVRRVLEVATKRRSPLAMDFGLTVTCAAAAGLHHAHERRGVDGAPLGIVHRDVSPSNLLLGHDGSIKLIDFGIAKAHLRTTQTAAGLVKGKAGYMAPEQVRGQPVDRRTDVFALGVLAYELTTQTRAFPGASEFESMRRTIHGEVDPPAKRVANYPPALEDVVMTALANDPADRFQDANAMRLSLEQVARELGMTLGDEPVIRALEKLFPVRPEPWFESDEPAADDETSGVSFSEPSIVITPRTATKQRIARGTENSEAITDSTGEPSNVQSLASYDLTRDPPAELTTTPFERASQPANEPLMAASTSPAPARVRRSTPREVAAPPRVRITAQLPLPPAPITPLSMPIPSGPLGAPASAANVDPLDPPTVRERVASMDSAMIRARVAAADAVTLAPVDAADSITMTAPVERVAGPADSVTMTAPVERVAASDSATMTAPVERVASSSAQAADSITIPKSVEPAGSLTIPRRLDGEDSATIRDPVQPVRAKRDSVDALESRAPRGRDRATQLIKTPSRYRQHALVVGVMVVFAVCALLLAMLLSSSSPTRKATQTPDASLPPPRSPPPAPPPAVATPEPRTSVMLHVTSDPEGATVVLDGERLGVTPFSGPVAIKPGDAVLKLRKQGYAAVKTRVLLDNDVRWDVQLRPLAR